MNGLESIEPLALSYDTGTVSLYLVWTLWKRSFQLVRGTARSKTAKAKSIRAAALLLCIINVDNVSDWVCIRITEYYNNSHSSLLMSKDYENTRTRFVPFFSCKECVFEAK